MESATTTQHPGRGGSLEPAHVPEALRVPHRAGERSIAAILRDYVALTKPRIISLLLLTTVTTMIVADPSGPALSVVLWTMLGGYLAAGGAGAINHYLDRDRDARMARTRGRPLVSGRIEPWHGLAFGIALGALATVQLAITVNVLSALLALAGLLGYVFVYTIWLKPLTPQNIVIGGAAGATAPLIASAAMTGSSPTLGAWLLFLVVFLWTPPHFWAIAIVRRREYEAAGFPMMPSVVGDQATRWRSLAYALSLLPVTLAPVWLCGSSVAYGVVATALGLWFVWLVARSLVERRPAADQRVFRGSVAYLGLLFGALIADLVLGR